MGINLAWFLANYDRKESLDEGDTMHPDRLRVLLFPDESLNISAQARSILSYIFLFIFISLGIRILLLMQQLMIIIGSSNRKF